jgi:RNA polymerase sigma-70 factor (ECF subfamily)
MDQVSSAIPAAVGDARERPDGAERDGIGARAVGAERVAAEGQSCEQFVQLYRELFPPLYGFVRFRIGDAHAAEDLTAQIFERALRRLATVRRPERARAWLFAIARNAIVDYRRGRRGSVELEQAERLEHLLIDSPEGEVIRRDEWRRLVVHLRTLSDRERELLGLRFAAGLGHREIGRIVGLSESNVAQIVHRALAKLRARFDAEEQSE